MLTLETQHKINWLEDVFLMVLESELLNVARYQSLTIQFAMNVQLLAMLMKAFIEDPTFIYLKIFLKPIKKKWCNTSWILMENATTTLLDAKDIHLMAIISWIVPHVIYLITSWILKNVSFAKISWINAWTAH